MVFPYFILAIVTSGILGVFYLLAAFMMLVGFKISRPTVDRHIYHLIQYLFSALFLALGIHYLHIGYHGAVHGVIPSQMTPVAAIANVLQAISLPVILVIALYIRFRAGSVDGDD